MDYMPIAPPPGSHPNDRASVRSRFTVIAVVLGMIVSAMLVWSTSRAAFTATTTNGSNSWTSAKVLIEDDDSAGVMFSPTGLEPGDPPASHCIEVTYKGNTAANVRLYADTYTHTKADGTADGLAANASLGAYINLTVEQDTAVGPNGSYAGCGNFDGGGAPIYNGTVHDFSTETFASNLGTWAPNAVDQKKVFKFTYSLQDNNAAQDLKCTVRFVFEAQST